MTSCLPGLPTPWPKRRGGSAGAPRTRHHARFSGVAALLALMVAGTSSYTVEQGDTLNDIAERNGTSSRALAEANGLANADLIRPGTTLTIAGAGTAAPTASAASTSTASTSNGGGTHTVLEGERLWQIAERYGVTTRQIADVNGIANRDLIIWGTQLTLPGESGQASTAQEAPTADAPAAEEAAPAEEPAPATPPAGSASRAEVGALLESTAAAYGFNPAFVKAIAWQESGWRNDAVSSAGARGIMQVMPATGEWVSTYLAGRPLDLGDPADNVLAGVLFLDYLHRIAGGDTERILGGYYQGLQSIEANGRYPSTDSYITNVLRLRDRF